MKRVLLIISFLFFQNWATAQEVKRALMLNFGTQNIWERDYGYSPLVFQGSNAGFTLGYMNVGEKKRDEVYLHYSRIPMLNDFDATMVGTHASVMTYTFYKANWLPEKFIFGWSNNNALSLRNFQDAQNFNPRFDYHTSFGPAIRFQTNFGNEQKWRFTSQAHWQIIGFLFSASYVTSPPDPFLHEQSTFNAFWQSIKFFQPFQQYDLGILNQLFYQLPNRNELGIGYRFNYTSLENAHRSQRSGGHYFFQLNFKL
jgi:hypothetical protein